MILWLRSLRTGMLDFLQAAIEMRAEREILDKKHREDGKSPV